MIAINFAFMRPAIGHEHPLILSDRVDKWFFSIAGAIDSPGVHNANRFPVPKTACKSSKNQIPRAGRSRRCFAKPPRMSRHKDPMPTWTTLIKNPANTAAGSEALALKIMCSISSWSIYRRAGECRELWPSHRDVINLGDNFRCHQDGSTVEPQRCRNREYGIGPLD